MNRLLVALVALLVIAHSEAQTPVEQTLVLEPSADTSLFEEGELSNGAGDYLFTGTTALGTLRRALLRFDLTSIPVDAEITSAALTLEMSRTISSTLTVRLHRVTTDWGEGASDAVDQEGTGIAAEPGDATWTQAIVGVSTWDTPGGDFLVDASASIRMRDLGTYRYESEGMLTDITGWFRGDINNYGWILVSNEGTGFTTAKRLNSRENPLEQTRPTLTLTYLSTPAPVPQMVPLSAGATALLAALIILTTRLGLARPWMR